MSKNEEEYDAQEPAGPQTVLVCVDGSRISAKAFDVALRLSRDDASSRLIALHVEDPAKPHLPKHFNAKFLMFQLERKCVMAGRKNFELVVEPKADRNVGEVIKDIAMDKGADLMVLGQFGRKGTSVWSSGSNTDWILRTLPQTPVIVKVKSNPMTAPTGFHYMAAADGSQPMTGAVVLRAAAFMRPGVDKLTVLHIKHPDDVHFTGSGFARYNSRSSMTASAALHRPSSAVPAGGDGHESPRQRVKGVDFEVDLTADARHKLVEEMRARGIECSMLVEPQRRGVGVAQHICTVAEEQAVDVLVIGADGMRAAASGRGGAAIAGSTADHVVRTARCTTVVVKLQ